jgi:DNA-binding GntR family transcriptional regulator
MSGDSLRVDEKASVTASEAAVIQLRKDILSGNLAPNEKLRVRALTARYGIGTSPMREALARLSGTDLVRLEGQKGFRVTPISLRDLVDITSTRKIVEGEALALALEAGNDLWEGEILKTFHVLCRELSRRGDGTSAWLDTFEARHHEFHRALIAACPLNSLKSYCEDLYCRKERYRRVLFGYAFDQVDVRAEHENLMNAVLSRDLQRARKALMEHIGLTADLLARLLPSRDSENHFDLKN